MIRISYIDSYNKAKGYYKLLNDEPYISSIKRIKSNSKIQNIILFLFRHKQYKIIYILLKYKNRIRNTKKLENDNFIKI